MNSDTELERLKRQNQAMREALIDAQHVLHHDYGRRLGTIENALSDSVGSDLLTREQVKPLVDCIEVIGSQNHNLECPKCCVCEAVDAALAHAKTLGFDT